MMRIVTGCTLALVCGPLFAQSFPQEKLKDWEFRFYACKNVVMQASAVMQLMKDHLLLGLDGVKNLREQTGELLAKAIRENERGVSFSEGEAAFVSDLTYTLVSGMIVEGLDLTELQLIRSGPDLCISTIQNMAE